MAQTQFAYQSETFSINERLANAFRAKTYTSISNYLGENEFTVRGTIPKLLPAICSFLDSNEVQSRDLGKFSSLIINYRESLGNFNLNNIEQTHFSTLTDIGTVDLTELFGTKLSALLDNISLVSGLKEESVFTLLALLIPSLLKQIGTHLPKGPAFTTSLISLIDENKEIFQDLIREAKPNVQRLTNATQKKSNLFLYFIIVTLSAFLVLSGMIYLTKKPELYKARLNQILISVVQVEKDLRERVGLTKSLFSKVERNVSTSETGNEEGAQNSKNNIVYEGLKNEDLELRFDPSAVKNKDVTDLGSRVHLEQELDTFIREDSGIKLRTFVLDKVKFGFGMTTLSEEAIEQLLQAVQPLKRIEDLHIEIAGHTDNTGNEETNKKLSKERAEAIKSIFVQNGLAPSNIHTIGYGSARPIATNSTLEGRYLNRRIELLLAKGR